MMIQEKIQSEVIMFSIDFEKEIINKIQKSKSIDEERICKSCSEYSVKYVENNSVFDKDLSMDQQITHLICIDFLYLNNNNLMYKLDIHNLICLLVNQRLEIDDPMYVDYRSYE